VIPANTPPSQPGNPGWLWLLFTAYDASMPTQPSVVCMLPYLADRDPSPGDNPVDYITDLMSPFIDPLTLTWSIWVNLNLAGFYWQTALGLQQWLAEPAGSPITGTQLGQSWPCQVIFPIWKTTARYPLGRPYWRVPFVTATCSPQGRQLSAYGEIAYGALAQALATPIISHGITFTPASWNRASNMFEALTGTFIGSGCGTMMRRGAFRNRGYGINMTTYTWMY
jgi:hypothetical protein